MNAGAMEEGDQRFVDVEGNMKGAKEKSNTTQKARFGATRKRSSLTSLTDRRLISVGRARTRL